MRFPSKLGGGKNLLSKTIQKGLESGKAVAKKNAEKATSKIPTRKRGTARKSTTTRKSTTRKPPRTLKKKAPRRTAKDSSPPEKKRRISMPFGGGSSGPKMADRLPCLSGKQWTTGVITAMIMVGTELVIRPIQFRFGHIWFSKIRGEWYAFSLKGANILRYSYFGALPVRCVRYRLDALPMPFQSTMDLLCRLPVWSFSAWLEGVIAKRRAPPSFHSETIDGLVGELRSTVLHTVRPELKDVFKMLADVLEHLSVDHICMPAPTFSRIVGADVAKINPFSHGAMIARQLGVENNGNLLVGGGLLAKASDGGKQGLIVIGVIGGGILLIMMVMGGPELFLAKVSGVIPGFDYTPGQGVTTGGSSGGGGGGGSSSASCDPMTLPQRYPTPMDMAMAVATGEETCPLPQEATDITRAVSDADLKSALLLDGRVAPNAIDQAIADMRGKYGDAYE